MPLQGDPIQLTLQLEDGVTSQFPRAYLTDSAGAAVSGSPADLTHEGNGLYVNSAVNMPNSAIVKVTYKVFSDSGHTTLNTAYGHALDNFYLTSADDAEQILDTELVETGLTVRQALKLIASAVAGKLSGATTTTVTIKNAVADNKNRITATVDADGNRSAITYDLT